MGVSFQFLLYHISEKSVLSQITGVKRPDFLESPVFSTGEGILGVKIFLENFVGNPMENTIE